MCVDRKLVPRCDHEPWPWPWIFMVKFWNISGMGGPIDMESKWVKRMLDSLCDLEFWPYLWPWSWEFYRKFWKKHISETAQHPLTWNKRDIGTTIWPWTMTLISHFQGQILKYWNLRNGKAIWNGTKWMWGNRMLYQLILFISPVSEGSGDVMVLRRSRPPPAARRPPPAARRPQWC